VGRPCALCPTPAGSKRELTVYALPFIIVTNTSCTDTKTGKLLNSITTKGPNMLSDPYRILLRFRNRKYAISTDVTEAYHGLRTGDVEMHLRRVIYRCKSPDEQAILECCLENGGLRSTVVEIKQGIPMVQTRFKVKTQHYFGAPTDLGLNKTWVLVVF
jgi:hypothetical protein